MYSKIIKGSKAMFIFTILVSTQFVITTNLASAYGTSEWDSHGKITPDGKKSIKGLEHHKTVAKHSIPFRKHAEANTAVIPSRQQVIANITSSRNFTMNGIINGIGYDNVTPPDVQVAVGPANVMEMINLQGQVWTKAGTPVAEPFDLESFFGTGADFISDPKVLYDNISQRWFASITDIPVSTVKVAVSDTNDATNGIFCIYSLTSSSSVIPDQPILGISGDKVVISTNDFDWNTGQFKYSQFWVLNKSDMMSCMPLNYVTKTMPGHFSIHPVQSLSKTLTQYMVSTSHTAGSFVNVYAVNGVPPNPVSLSITQVQTSSISDPPNAIQPSTSLLLDTGDSRVQDAIWTQGTLWMTHNNKCVPSNDSAPRSCLHLVEINTDDMKIEQDFDFGVKNQYLFYPAIKELPSGNLFVVYGFSSATAYPGIAVTEQAITDPKNSLQYPSVMQPGSGPVNLLFGCLDSCRYGDYFGAGLDPANPNGVWVAGEYGTGEQDKDGFGQAWGTAIGNFTG
jgi:hypothetical protein